MLTLAVIYTISWAEDYTNEYPLWQFRYHGAYLPVLIVLTVLSFERRLSSAGKSWLRAAVLIVSCAAMALFYPRPAEELTSVYDNATINLFNHSLYFYGSDLDLALRQNISLVLLLISASALFLPFTVSAAGRRLKAAGLASLSAAAVLFTVWAIFTLQLTESRTAYRPISKAMR